MYCSECKLRVADDSITVCPVCQGPLQSDAVNEEAFNDAADNEGGSATSEIRVEDKFSAYERSDQELDFSLEKLGLESSVQKDPADEEEDIQALADLWEEEDIDADLEGVLAEAFSLDEANKDSDPEDDLEGVFTEAFSLDEVSRESDIEDDFDLEEDDLDPGKGLDLEKPATLPPQPPVVAPSRNQSSWLLILLIIVIGAGGGFWLYSQKLQLPPGKRVAGSVSKPQSVNPVSLPSVKEEIVVAKKVVAPELAAEAVGRVADDKTAKIEASVPAQDGASVKVSELKDEIIKAPVPEAAVDSVPAVASRELKTAETLLAPSAGVEKKKSTLKKSASEKVPAEGEVKFVAETKPQVSTPDSVPEKKVDRKSPKTVKAASVKKTGVSLTFPYAIHIGSFKSRKSVARQLAMLQEKGFAAYQVEVDLKNKGVWRRVLVPGGTTRKEAKVVQRKLAELFPREESLILKIKK